MSAPGQLVARASVVVPVLNASRRIGPLLEALEQQQAPFEWELLFLDSGSTDGTRALLEAWGAHVAPAVRVAELGPEPFDHGDARNLGAALTRGEVIVFVTDDARPLSTRWLERLVAEANQAGAACCRNQVPPETPAWARALCAGDPNYAAGRVPAPEGPATPDGLYARAAYCDTASALRRDLWLRHPYPRGEAGEDMLLARALVEHGIEIAYLEDEPVEHVHLYTPDQLRARACLDGRFNLEAFGRAIAAHDWSEGGTDGARGAVARGLEACLRVLRQEGLPRDELARQRDELEPRLGAFVEGAQHGMASARGRRWPTSVLAPGPVRVGLLPPLGRTAGVAALVRELEAFGVEARAVAPDDVPGPLEAVHVLSTPEPAWTAPGGPLDRLPCLVAEPGAWRLHLFGLRERPHGAHDRPELRVRAPHPLDEEPARAAARWGFRYRQLLCMARARCGYERWGREADRVTGDARLEGPVALTLGPGPGSAEFHLPPLGSGAFELAVEVELHASEVGTTRCAVASIDGREVLLAGSLEVPAGLDVVGARAVVGLPREGARLELANRTPAGEPTICRLRSLELRRVPEPPIDAPLRIAPAPRSNGRPLPPIAVVVVSLLGRRTLAACLGSLQACDYPADRLRTLVIDNGGARDTGRWLASAHPAACHLVPGGNVGFTRAANLGACSAGEAEVLVFLNDDARAEPGFLRELVAPIAAGRCASTGARMSLASGEPEYLGGAASFQGLAFGGPLDPELAATLDRPRRTLFACGGAMAVGAEVFRGCGGFDEDYFAYYDDLDLGWRLWLQGHEVHYAPGARCTHARSSTSSRFPAARIRLLQVRNALRTCIKNLGDEALRATLPALLALAMRRLWIQAGAVDVEPLRIEFKRPPRLRRSRRLALPGMAAADLVALQDVLGDWETWMEKRRLVQAARRRLDAEIFPLFLDPLRCVEDEGPYVALQDSLVRLFDLQRTFGGPERAAP